MRNPDCLGDQAVNAMRSQPEGHWFESSHCRPVLLSSALLLAELESVFMHGLIQCDACNRTNQV